MSITSDRILEFLRTEGGFQGEIEGQTKLFSSGLLDSFLMIELIMFLETTGGFQIPADAITLDNLDSIDAILAYCESLSMSA